MEKDQNILNEFLKKNKERHLVFLKLYVHQDDEHEELSRKIEIAESELKKYEISHTLRASVFDFPDGLFKPEVKEYIVNLSLLQSERKILHSLNEYLKKTPPECTLTEVIAKDHEQLEKLEQEPEIVKRNKLVKKLETKKDHLVELEFEMSKRTPFHPQTERHIEISNTINKLRNQIGNIEDEISKLKPQTDHIDIAPTILKRAIREAEHIKGLSEEATKYQNKITELEQRNQEIKPIVAEELQKALDEGKEAKQNGKPLGDGLLFVNLSKRTLQAIEIAEALNEYKEPDPDEIKKLKLKLHQLHTEEDKYIQEDGHWYMRGEKKKVIDINDEDYERLCKFNPQYLMRIQETIGNIYARGKKDGYAEGESDGYAAGEKDGYSKGEKDGYSYGYEKGYDDGYSDGKSSVNW